MKMAKASEADLKMAFELCQVLDALTGLCATMPEKINLSEDEEYPEDFDRDDAEQCKRVVAYLCDLADSGSLSRVVFGIAVLLDPANKVVDPDADTLEYHPDTVAALAAMAERAENPAHTNYA